MMRLAIVATPAALPDLRPAPGALDGDALRSRLLLADAGFHVVDLDPAVDLAEQLEVLFEETELEKETPALFYASCAVARTNDGELFLCLDPSSPETGDSLRDITTVIREHVGGPVAVVLECRERVPPGDADPFRSAMVVASAKDAVRNLGAGVELLVAARALSSEAEERPSPLTRALIEALDEADAARGLTIAGFYEEVTASEKLLGVVPCFAHVKASAPFQILEPDPSAQPAIAPEPVASTPPPKPVASTPPPERAPSAPPPKLSAPPPPPPVPVLRASAPPAVAELRSEARSAPPTALPEARSFTKAEPALARVIVADVVRSSSPPPAEPAAAKPSVPPPARASDVPPPRASEAPPAASIPPVASAPPPAASAPPPSETPKAPATPADHLADGDAIADRDPEGALAAYRRALGLLGGGASKDRADIYVRIGQIKRAQDKRREAIANYEKALGLSPGYRPALEALIELDVAEGDWRAVHAAEERLLGTITDEAERFARMVAFAYRWRAVARDSARARAAYERARELRPDDLDVLGALRKLYEEAGLTSEAIALRRRVADLTKAPRARAEQLFDLGKYLLEHEKQEEPALELFDRALEADPSMLEPLALIAQSFADRQEWSELEQAYRKMLARAPRIPDPGVRTQVTWELCRLLGTLFRDHLEDPSLALDAFEDAIAEKPGDLSTRLTAAELARSISAFDRAALHLQAAARIEPARLQTFHDLFDLFQKLRRPDEAYAAASVTMFLRKSESRERFIFEEHKPEGVPKLVHSMRGDGWDLLRPVDRDRNLGAVLGAVTPAAISARLAQLSAEGRLPALDPAARQDPAKTTLSIVRSFVWASHYLGVPPPAIYLHDDPAVGLAAVMSEEPTAIAGGRVLRGRSLAELAFFAGRHLGYHVGEHRLMLYYPSIEELSSCFLAAVKIALPELPIPAQAEAAALDLAERIEEHLGESAREELGRAVAAFESARVRADIAGWVGSVERCATRAGYLLAADLEVAASVLRSDPLGVVSTEDKLGDLLAFTVSDEHHLLREEVGIAIQP